MYAVFRIMFGIFVIGTGLFGAYLGVSVLFNNVTWTIKAMASMLVLVSLLIMCIGISIIRGGSVTKALSDLFEIITNH